MMFMFIITSTVILTCKRLTRRMLNDANDIIKFFQTEETPFLIR